MLLSALLQPEDMKLFPPARQHSLAKQHSAAQAGPHQQVDTNRGQQRDLSITTCSSTPWPTPTSHPR